MENREMRMKVAEYIIDYDRATGFLKHDTHAYIFDVGAALYWKGITKGIAGEYRPGRNMLSIRDEEEAINLCFDDFSDWTVDEMENLSIAMEYIWDEATRREEER